MIGALILLGFICFMLVASCSKQEERIIQLERRIRILEDK